MIFIIIGFLIMPVIECIAHWIFNRYSIFHLFIWWLVTYSNINIWWFFYFSNSIVQLYIFMYSKKKENKKIEKKQQQKMHRRVVCMIHILRKIYKKMIDSQSNFKSSIWIKKCEYESISSEWLWGIWKWVKIENVFVTFKWLSLKSTL